MDISKTILSDLIIFMKYSRYLPKLKRRETFDELITRNAAMHIKKFPQLKSEIKEAYKLVYDKKVLPSMRALQFSGKPIDLNPARLFNCSFAPIDHPDAFAEAMFLLLSGCGFGFSVQRHHVEELPEIRKPRKLRRYLVGDSIEGWSDAVKVLVNAYFEGKSLPDFDFQDIRPKGARLITSGGKAPGSEPLKNCLHHIQKIFDRKQDGDKLESIDVHDIVCHIADCVLAGGIRRAACCALFDLDDDDMFTAKYGNWYEGNPQRGRANNSAVILRHKIDRETFFDMWKKIELSNSGEPGIFFTNDKEYGANPCFEISLRGRTMCNLTTINVEDVETQDDLNARAKGASFIATLQASYTNFHYLRESWKKNIEKDALIGVSMTGIASGKVMGLNLKEAAEIVKEENARVAELIGINKAARTTCVKPEGSASLVLGTSSGIHAYHNDYYLRRVRAGKNEAIYQYLLENHPELIEDEFFKPHLQAVISLPQRAPEGAITRHESALHLLDRVAKVWKTWVKTGHRKGANVNNVSTTISIKKNEWLEVGEWMWENRDNFTALACLPAEEDGHGYVQLPFEDITEDKYELLMKSLHKIDLTKVVELEDDTELQQTVACGGGSCQIV